MYNKFYNIQHVTTNDGEHWRLLLNNQIVLYKHANLSQVLFDFNKRNAEANGTLALSDSVVYIDYRVESLDDLLGGCSYSTLSKGNNPSFDDDEYDTWDDDDD